MHTPAFTSPFTGAALRARHTNPSAAPRCAMGDSIAPKISIKDTRSDQTSKVTVEWEAVLPNTSAAQSVESNVALNVALRSTRKAPATLPAAATPPPGVAPADFYFPKDTRNEAPVISMAYDQSISVAYETINPVVGGTAANSVESVAFWKKKEYKWSAPATAPASAEEPEVLDSTMYERYFPSNIRNRAPMISMKPPAGDWDTTAFLQVGSEFVQLNPNMARELSVSAGADEPAVKAAATVEKYFGGPGMNKAPVIDIVPEDRVTIGFETILAPLGEAQSLLVREGAATA